MQNDDINSRTIAIVKKASIVTVKQVINLMKKILEINKLKTQTEQSRPLEKFKKVKVKDLVKKGKVETLELNDIDLKALKKELKRYGVKFSIKKDLENGNNIIFFQAKDIKVMEQAFKKTVQKFTKDKSRKRKSVIERLNNFKDKVKDTIDRDKVKHKHQEQSL
ncbi:TPA: PcfB family protein [Enterococcus faecium]|uniref:PcfB family protein n=1 Tax=Enterococcus faecium TaxID=1352 RepID=UPI0012615AD5|nr:PcfB family protein [Enterococcus faecium]KAB7592851.1 PcfB family protein [Enterococcus faecium]HAP6332582.1 PcfB family protein [Enterococcus faecium]HAP6335494.1 PcfB family protein [Enterococcus faecium]